MISKISEPEQNFSPLLLPKLINILANFKILLVSTNSNRIKIYIYIFKSIAHIIITDI